MIKTFQSILAYLLLAVFLFNITGYSILFKGMQYRIKKEMTTYIRQRALPTDCITFSYQKKQLEKINWKEEGKELCIYGKLFDVVSIESKGETVLIRCINDKKEEQLLSSMDHFIKQNIVNGFLHDKSHKDLTKLIVKNYFSENLISFSHYPSYCFIKIRPSLMLHEPVSKEVISPPPQLS